MVDSGDYQHDFVLWTRSQAEILRAAARSGANLPVDWENVAEEIDSLGRSDRREIASRIGTIIEYLLKLQSSRATAPRSGWETTIERARIAIMRLVDESPSLRADLTGMIAREMPGARRLAARELAAYGEHLTDVPDYTEEQVLGDWLP
jgi:hypothetical protein